MKRVAIGDVSLNVVEEGRGPALLLAHGFPLDHAMWREQIAALRDSCRVIAPDLRGFGQSDVTPGVATMEQLADDLAALLDALGERGPVAFCGLSMGGYIGWQFALRHRDRLGRLILCDTRAVADSAEAARARRLSAQQAREQGPAALAEGMLAKLFCPATHAHRPQLVEETRQVILRSPAEGIAAALLGMAQRPDVTDRLPGLDVPALVVCGEHDGISPPAEMQKIAQALPQARYVQIADAGHMAPLEQPQAVNAALREFLAAG